MLVLISFGLVLVATVLLVLGLVQDSGLALIYVSIACSLAAGIILVIATRVNRPRAESAIGGGTGPAPLPPVDEPTVAATPDVVVTPAAAPEATPAPAAAEVGGAAAAESFAPVTESVTVVPAEDDELFPIADYDDLSVGEIVPLLPKLYADEIDVVEQRERSGKSRRQILDRLAELRVEFEGAPEDVTAEEWAEQRGASAPAPAPAEKKVVKKAPAAKKAAAPAKKPAAPTKKVTAPAKKAAAPAKKAAASTKKAAAPAKKAAASTKKASAPAKKAAASTKKAATTTTAKKAAAPAKKATKATKATKKS